MSGNIKKIALFSLMGLSACRVAEEKKDKTAIFQQYLHNIGGKDIPQEYHLYVLQPERGCGGCVTGINRSLKTWEQPSNATVIMTYGFRAGDLAETKRDILCDTGKLLLRMIYGDSLEAYDASYIYTSKGRIDSVTVNKPLETEQFIRKEIVKAKAVNTLGL